ncbi:MAG TPA: type IV pilus assembly protein PilM [Thermodesulfobacteriaceae bacterium]|nr:type IV pilus assembly protein PilM [Thermodesulfobacteriaceae bacterium]
MKFSSMPKKLRKGKNRPVLGLDIGSHSIKLMEFSNNGPNRQIRRIGMALVPHGTIVDGSIKEPDKVINVLASLIENLSPKIGHCGISIAGYSVIVKKVRVLYQDERELEENLMFEAEKYVPFEIEDVYVDFHRLNRDNEQKNGMEIFLVAAKREIVDSYANIIQEAGLMPAVVDVDAFAMGNAQEGAFGLVKDVTILVDIGASKTNLNITASGQSLFARDMAFGGNQLTEAIQEATGLDWKEAEQTKIRGSEEQALMKEVAPLCREHCLLWASEVRKAIDFHISNSGLQEQPRHMLLSGGSALLKDLDRLFSRETGMTVKIFNPLENYSVGKDIDTEYVASVAPQMVIATGLAMRTG